MPLISTRKRVTKAGRGAHAIYLPKAWLDAWSPKQAERAEIDLISLDEHLVLSPVFTGEEPVVTLDDDRSDLLVRMLLSGYVTGHRAFTVHRPGGFSDAQLMEARRFLRLLDERLDVTWADDRIRFSRDPRGTTALTVTGHLEDLFAKVEEAAESLQEVLEHFPHNPQRVLHAVHLVTAIERDDIQRIKNQGYRQVARLQVPAERVADLQLLMLATHTLARMGKLLVETACTLSDHFGIRRDRLHYPPELLEEGLRPVAAPGPVFRGFVDRARADLLIYIDLLGEARRLARSGGRDSAGVAMDGRAALDLSERAQEAHDTLASKLMTQVGKEWGPGFVQEDPAAMYRIVKVHVHVQDLLEELRALADRVVDFRLSERGAPVPSRM